MSYDPPCPVHRDMCQEISTNWGSQTWQDFDQLCEYNPVEAELLNCLADVREPCQLGCRDLTYCTNFNNRSVACCSPSCVTSDPFWSGDLPEGAAPPQASWYLRSLGSDHMSPFTAHASRKSSNTFIHPSDDCLNVCVGKRLRKRQKRHLWVELTGSQQV